MLKKIYQTIWNAWRLTAMILFFILFGVFGLILSYGIFPCLRFLGDRNVAEKYKAQYAIHLMFRFMIFMLHFLRLINFTFVGFEKLPADKGCLILANHPTLLDYVAIVSRMPHCENIVKEALWRNSFIKKVITKAGYIPNLQSDKTFDAVKSVLEDGNNLLMFPEGTRTVPNQPLELKRGAAQLAIRIGAPIRLIHIACLPRLLTKQEKWYTLPATQPQFTLTVGERIEPTDYFKATDLPSVAARQLTRYLQDQLS